MQIALAPMEGLVDDILRDVLTRVGGIDWCVTEFIRVSQQLLPARCFLGLAPELAHGARTRAGTPMRVQLLGSDPACLADNAARAVKLGAPVIDLNFGCPAKTVNRSRGGAVLLKEPELLHRILREVRRTLPPTVPLTAKMRLGYEHTDLALDCARALADGGAAQIVVHARTKTDGYRPPAHWEWIARVRDAVLRLDHPPPRHVRLAGEQEELDALRVGRRPAGRRAAPPESRDQREKRDGEATSPHPCSVLGDAATAPWRSSSRTTRRRVSSSGSAFRAMCSRNASLTML